MIDFEELKKRGDIKAQIDWDLTAQEAFEKFQIKSPGGWRHGQVSEAVFFSIYVHQGQARLFLVRRSLKHTEDICLIPAPPDLLHQCVTSQGGDPVAQGQYNLDPPLRAWLERELNV